MVWVSRYRVETYGQIKSADIVLISCESIVQEFIIKWLRVVSECVYTCVYVHIRVGIKCVQLIVYSTSCMAIREDTYM